METKINSNVKCNRQEDLVTYLYDEASQDERQAFELHLGQCASCRTEFNDFASVRDSLGSWNLDFEASAPPLQVTIKRNSIETLRDVIRALRTAPGWVKLAGGAAFATAGLLVVFAVAGTRIDLNQGTISFGLRHNEAQVATSTRSGGVEEVQAKLTKAEAERIIAERVAAVTGEDRRKQEELSLRVAGLSAQLASVSESRGRVAAELASLRAEQRVLAARGQATLGEWLFAANDSRHAWGGSDERDK
jgi:hypothetical protein